MLRHSSECALAVHGERLVPAVHATLIMLQALMAANAYHSDLAILP